MGKLRGLIDISTGVELDDARTLSLWEKAGDTLTPSTSGDNVQLGGSFTSENINTRGFNRLNPNTKGEVSAVASTQTFSHSVKGGELEFYFWAGGIKYSKTTTQSITFTNTTGTYYFYYDTSGVLQFIENSAMTEDIFLVSAICGLVYYNKEEGTVWLAKDEFHGIIMDSADHLLTHMTLKFRNSHGGDITGLADGSTTFTNISTGVYHDEDIIKATPTSTALKFMYRDGTTGGWKLHSNTADNAIALMNGSNAVWNEWNGSIWKLTDCASSTDFVIGYILETNLDGEPGRVKVVGQHAYPNRNTARNALFKNVDTLYLEGLSSSECQFQFAYIYKRNGTLEDDGNTEVYVDLRKYQSSGSSSSSVSHNGLAGLNTGDYQHLTLSEFNRFQNLAGVYAYLNTATTTTCKINNNWYPIAGSFTNDLTNFSFVTDRIRYDGTLTEKFEIDYHALVKSDSNGTTPHICISKCSTNSTPVSITAMSSGTNTTITSTGHGLSNDDCVEIVGTTNYNGLFTVSGVTTDTFDINAAYVANDATGTWTECEILATQKMGIYCKTAGEAFGISGTNVLELETNDTIQIVLQVDKTNEDIIVSHFTTTIARFLR